MDKNEELAKRVVDQFMKKVLRDNKVDIDNVSELKTVTKQYVEDIQSEEMKYTLTHFDRIFEELYKDIKGRSDEEKSQKESDNEFKAMIRNVRRNMLQDEQQNLQIKQTLQEKVDEYNKMVEESKNCNKQNKKTLKYAEIKNGEIGPEKEIDWDR